MQPALQWPHICCWVLAVRGVLGAAFNATIIVAGPKVYWKYDGLLCFPYNLSSVLLLGVHTGMQAATHPRTCSGLSVASIIFYIARDFARIRGSGVML